MRPSAIIVAGLRAAAPDIPVVAEEEIAAGHMPAQADAFWLVDPLDGTREFANRRDDFAVNIGLVRDGRPVLGVVGVPAAGDVLWRHRRARRLAARRLRRRGRSPRARRRRRGSR